MSLPEYRVDLEKKKFVETAAGDVAVRSQITGDIQIGAVEIKDGATDRRASVSVAGELKVEGAVTTDVDVSTLSTSAKQLPDDHNVTVSNTVTVDATDLDIRDLVHTADSVNVGDGTNLISVDTTNALKTFDAVANSLIPSVYDYISLSYTGSNLTGVVYKTGGSGGSTVSTLILAYDGSDNLTSVTKS